MTKRRGRCGCGQCCGFCFRRYVSASRTAFSLEALSPDVFGYTYRSVFERIFSVLMIRLARFGARKQPYYRVVVIEKDRARNGRSIEVVGTYNPRTNPASVDLKRDRIEYWTGKGAQLSDTVGKLLNKQPAAPAETPASV